ncbi:MAG: hypothetical protein JWR22_2437 [Herminiimonas sp.]|nr:hypothetical protein [Herminiimonas sp.]
MPGGFLRSGHKLPDTEINMEPTFCDGRTKNLYLLIAARTTL